MNRPLAPYPLVAWADWSFDGAPIRIGQVVETVKRVNGLGTVLEPLAVAPAIGIAISPRFGIVPLDAKAFPVKTVIHSNVKGAGKRHRPARSPGRLEGGPRLRALLHR